MKDINERNKTLYEFYHQRFPASITSISCKTTSKSTYWSEVNKRKEKKHNLLLCS